MFIYFPFDFLSCHSRSYSDHPVEKLHGDLFPLITHSHIMGYLTFLSLFRPSFLEAILYVFLSEAHLQVRLIFHAQLLVSVWPSIKYLAGG